ncbi:MAG: hypothetical protein KKC37_12625, partial [Proteobacteria bacterium]|nr:hypothetical protein [Pseudomonadota bacterium]
MGFRGGGSEKKKRRTLWEKWTQKEEPPEREDQKIFNPLHIYVGGFVSLSDPEVSGDFEVKTVAEYDRGADKMTRALVSLGEETHLVETDLDEADGKVKTYLFHNVDEFGFDEEFLKILGDPEMTDEDGVTFQNALGTKEPVTAVARVITDPGGAVDKRSLSLWAYEREAPQGMEYLHIEMDEADG